MTGTEKNPKPGVVVELITLVIFGLIAWGGYKLFFSGEPSPPKPSVPYEAITACQNLIKKNANHPSTVRFPMGTTSTDMKAEGGGYRVKLGFTAKNSFGLETRFDALCKFKPGSLEIADFGAWERDK